jgi:hypothetical protein
MIQEFITRFDANRESLRAKFAQKHPEEYRDIVVAVIETIAEDEYGLPDPTRITEINDGDYQGTMLFVIGARGYQPRKYWAVYVDYGSCSGCDTLMSIQTDDDRKTMEKQVSEYMTLAIHILQGLKEI